MKTQKVALIVAGGSGMGAGAARQLAKDGFKVAIMSSSGKGVALAEELGGVGVTGSNLVAADIEAFVALAAKTYGRIDVLVNSAGHGPRAPILELTDEQWHLGMEVYFLNAVRAARLVTPYMEKQGGGTIINITTFATFEPDPLFPTSGVFRAGLSSFTKLFADKYAAQNIRMNNVLPGFIDSLPETEDRRRAYRWAAMAKRRKCLPSSAIWRLTMQPISRVRISASMAGSRAQFKHWRFRGCIGRKEIATDAYVLHLPLACEIFFAFFCKRSLKLPVSFSGAFSSADATSVEGSSLQSS